MSDNYFFPAKAFDKFYDWFKLAFLRRVVGIEEDVADVADGTTDLTSYLRLSGRSGGQIAKGGVAAGEDLTLMSSAHATKGSILFGTSEYDEANNRLGIGGTPVAGAVLGVTGSTTYDSGSARGCYFGPTVNSSSNGIGGVGFQPTLKPSANITTAYGQIGIVAVDRDSTDTSRNVTTLNTNFYRTDTGSSYAGTIGTVNNFHIAAGSYAAGSTVTTEIGLRVAALSKGGTKYGIFVDSNDVHFGGRVLTPNVHNITGGNTASLHQISSGTYTPTLTGVANVQASTVYAAQWMRVGKVVTVSGQIDLDPTAAGTVQFTIGLPVASTFTHSSHLCGTAAVNTGGAPFPVGIYGNVAGLNALFTYSSSDGASRALLYHFTYLVV